MEMAEVHALPRLTGNMDEKTSSYGSVWPGPWGVPYGVRSQGDFRASRRDHHHHPVRQASFSSGFLWAACWLSPPPPPPLPAVVVLLLLPERGERLADFVPEWEPSSVAEPMWPGAGAGWEEALLPKPELHQTPINHLPKYSILDLPLVMFKLNILSFSLQAQLPPGMPSFRDYS